MSKPDPLPNHIGVAVVTTSGRWPAAGFESVPSHQKLQVALEHAARALHLVDTSGWLATFSGRELAIDASHLENDLSGHVVIDYGPRAGGGGHRA